MPRINVDDELRSDPRFHLLCTLLKRHEAYGSLICLWELGQAYWRKSESNIPRTLAEQTPNYPELLQAGFVTQVDGGVYCSGAKERWGFLLARAAAGRKSAEARKRLFGTAQPPGGRQTRKHRTTIEQESNKIEPSSSSSSSKRKNLPANAGNPVFFLKKYFLEKHGARYAGVDHPWEKREWGLAKKVLEVFNKNANGKDGAALCREAIDQYMASEEPFIVRECHHFKFFYLNPMKYMQRKESEGGVQFTTLSTGEGNGAH